MNSSHALKIRLAVYAGILIAFFAVLWGLEWHLEWDMNTGRERRVTAVWNIPLTHSDPMQTIVSQWLNQDADEAQWVVVASGLLEGPDLECLGRVVYHFEMMSNQVTDIEWKRAYASWVLDELSQTGRICRVGDHCNRVGQALMEADEEMTLSRLRHVWRRTASPGIRAGIAGR